MNKYQKIIALVAAVNIGLMCLFPPVLDSPIARFLLPSFDGFRPLFGLTRGQHVHADLLALQVLFVAANALAAWLAVAKPVGGGDIPAGRYAAGIGLFAGANLAVMFLFPPFEAYAGISRASAQTFDGFYFVFGERSRRALFAPILYLEILLIVINVLVVWVLFGVVQRRNATTRDEILDLARRLPPEEALQLSEELIHRAAEATVGQPRPDGGDRRQSPYPEPYRGRDRRNGADRRKRPR